MRPSPVVVFAELDVDVGVVVDWRVPQLTTKNKHRQNKERNFVIRPHRLTDKENQVIVLELLNKSGEIFYYMSGYIPRLDIFDLEVP